MSEPRRGFAPDRADDTPWGRVTARFGEAALGGGERVVLMLQGPMSPFFAYLRDELVDRGARVVKVQVCPADVVFWRRPSAIAFREPWSRFEAFLSALIARERVTDLVLWGDERELHRRAIDVCLAAGIRVHAMELGYLRPDWLTVEPDGLASSSRFPREPDAIRALASGLAQPSTDRLARGSFLTEAVYDVVFNLSNVVLAPLTYRHYRRHAIRHPLAEYAGWIAKWALRLLRPGDVDKTWSRMSAGEPPLFLMPLQLSTDFQIRAHSPFPALVDAVDLILASFARHAPTNARLLFKVHPLDNGLDRWDRTIPERAGRLGLAADRVAVVDGGDLGRMLARCRGVVTVNSTVGLTALEAGIPVIVLGNAVFDVPGLTHQGPLSTFWTDPDAPDPTLVADFRAALAYATQVRGGVITAGQIEIGADNAADRILETRQRLETGGPGPRGAKSFRRREELEAEAAAR
jgi:capsular polysaccharide export protein